ncbi:hypothetical protein DFU00_000657 [Salmonella enterica subsp. enterica serovar Wandsworth]|uniref:hypothetical protein n=1 Tax=Salmonella sp. SKLX119062 TaxID=3160090 RepID=UPI002A4E85C1|nr:hypothetical protein [Salmonella enterica]EDS5034033.1 hypothetical protein [Salmonella enterica subsp. enterica serovar Wandsworth]EDW6591852.1 hypothetical protein [Salmonella enterica]MDJ5665017.1 hypothetical protein [Salmonella enterica]
MHTFASLMYDVYRSFGLFSKGNRRAAIRGAATFSSHQRFFGNREDERHQEQKHYDEIIGVLDAEQVFSTTQRREIFYKYEQLYNALMARPVFTELSREQIKKRYALHIIPRLIALDIYKTYKDENKNCFYHHIHQFLLKDYCPCWQDKKKGGLSAVQKYLKSLARKQKFSHTDSENLAPLFKVIENIRPGNTQKKSTLEASIIDCIKAYSGIVDDDTLNSVRVSLDNIKKAHYSLTVLLNVERKLPVINIISRYYRNYVDNGIKPGNISAMLCRLLYEPEPHDFIHHDTMINSIADYYHERVIKPFSLNINEECLQSISALKNIIFNFNDKTIISEVQLTDIAVKLKKEPHKQFIQPYIELWKVIDLISKGETEEAFEKVKTISLDDLPAGYLASAFLVIHIALRIKFERKNVKNGVFSLSVTSILENQGIYTDYIPVSQAYTETHSDDSVIKSTLLSESILSDANNLTIIRSVRMYNNMVRRISDWNDLELEGIYPESVYGLLDKVDTILGKILNIIFSEKITSSQDLSCILKNNKILTQGELNDSLIGILVNCPLLACVRDIESLIKYLRCPGEEIRNMILSVDKKLWDLIYGALTILEEERKIQTGKTQGGGK